jgi:hypothetical protein
MVICSSPSVHSGDAVATPSGDHSAAGPALGYLYQFQVALRELIPHALAADETQATLEVFDDVAFDFSAGSPRRVLQIHHSVLSERELLDTSAKVWRTLAIWAGEWAALGASETRLMTLVTTQTARAGTGISALTNTHRDVEFAFARLSKIAADPDGASGTERDRRAFLNLPDAEQRALLDNVVVADGALGASEARSELVAALTPTHEQRFVESMADLVEGWWWPRVVAALSSGDPIDADEVRAAIDEARRSISDRALPILRLEDFQLDEIPLPDPDTALFLNCLRAISASVFRRRQAVDDYQRTFAHRSRWARRGLLGPMEYERYEDDLVAQWLIATDRMLRLVEEGANPDALQRAGHDLWDRLETDVRQPLRPETADSFIQRGSLHQLADDGRVAWHPDTARSIYHMRDDETTAA